MNKKECEIVKDLFLGYVEKTLRKGTNEFVEKHVETCEDCKKILDMLEEEKESEKKKEEKEKERQATKEIDYLKKYNKKMKILKIIAVVLTLFIILAWACEFIINKDTYKKGKITYDIIQTAYKNMKNFNDENNYILEIEVTRRGHYAMKESKYNTKYYYKDGKYKNEGEGDGLSKSIFYGPVEIKESLMLSEIYHINRWNESKDETITGIGELYIYDDGVLKDINLSLSQQDRSNLMDTNLRIQSLGTGETFPYTKILSELSPKLCAYLKLEEETYEGRECYVIKSGKEGDYQEIWIDKEKQLVIREISSNETKNFKWEKGTVTDEDVRIKSFEEYKQEGYRFEVEDWAKKLLP